MLPGVPEGRHNVAHGGSRGNQNRAWQESPGRGGTSGSRAQMQPITQECVVGQFTCSRLLAGQALAIPSPCEGLSVPACRWRYRTGQPRVSVLPGNPTHYQNLEAFRSSLSGIHGDRLAPIQQYPNICESKHPFGRAEEENPHPSQKLKGCGTRKFNAPQSLAHPPRGELISFWSKIATAPYCLGG
jgi:hypothetical protein